MHEKRMCNVLTCTYDISPFASTSRKRKNRGKWQTCFHSSYEWSIVGLQMTCGHPYGLCQLASTIPAHSYNQNFCETRFKTWTGLSCNSFCVFHSVIGIACLALQLCLLCIVKQGHRPRTVKASTLGITVMGIICLQSNFWTQKPKLGPAWCLQDFVGHCMVPFHPVLVQPRNAEM